MENLQIHIPTQTIELDNGRVTGCIYIQTGSGIIFPEKDWNDFICVVLTWWVNATLNVENRDSLNEFSFMDGPLKYTLNKHKETYNLSFWHRDSIVGEVNDIDLPKFKKNLYNTADSVLMYCRNQKFVSQEIDELESSISVFHE